MSRLRRLTWLHVAMVRCPSGKVTRPVLSIMCQGARVADSLGAPWPLQAA